MEPLPKLHAQGGLVQASTTIPGIRSCRIFKASPPSTQDPAEIFPQAVSFVLRYLATVDSLDLSEPFDEWYAKTATYQNADGRVYKGGETIWNWLRELFSSFGQIRHTFNSFTVLEYEPNMSTVSGHGNESNGRNLVESGCQGEEHDDLVMLDAEARFWLEGEVTGEGIKVPRMLSFRVHTRDLGANRIEQQIVEAKTWWDTSLLKDEMLRKEGMLS